MRTIGKLIIALSVVVLLLIGAGVYWFLRDDAPAKVAIDSAVAAVEDQSSTSSTSTSDPGSATEGVEGTWTVDTETGEFTYEKATGTFAGFRIEEELASIGATTAVGRTDAVTGEVTIDGLTLTAATFEVDLTSITTETSPAGRRGPGGAGDRAVPDGDVRADTSRSISVTLPRSPIRSASRPQAI